MKKINIQPLINILSHMLEAMYLEGFNNPEDYKCIVADYNEKYFLSDNQINTEQSIQSLKDSLIIILNDKSIDLVDLLNRYMHHSFADQTSCHRLFEIIWLFYFQNERWELTSKNLYQSEIVMYDNSHDVVEIKKNE